MLFQRLEEIFGLPIDALWRFFAAVLRKIYSTLTTVQETTVGHQVFKFSSRPKTDGHLCRAGSIGGPVL